MFDTAEKGVNDERASEVPDTPVQRGHRDRAPALSAEISEDQRTDDRENVRQYQPPAAPMSNVFLFFTFFIHIVLRKCLFGHSLYSAYPPSRVRVYARARDNKAGQPLKALYHEPVYLSRIYAINPENNKRRELFPPSFAYFSLLFVPVRSRDFL